MTDDAFGRDLVGMLAARDPGPPPVRLEAVVRNRIATDAARHVWPAALRIGIGAAGVVAAAALVVALGWAQRLGTIDGGVGQTVATPFDPNATGAGIVAQPDVFPVALLVTAALIGAAGVAARIVRRRWLRAALIVIAAVAALFSYGIGTATFVDWSGGSTAFGLGYVETRQPPDGTSFEPEATTATFQLAPNGVFTYGFDVHNSADVPITILGLAQDRDYRAWGSLNAVGLLREANFIDIRDPNRTRPFEPVQVEPDQYVFLVIAGRASHCALSPGSPPDPNGAGATFSTVDVVYEILGVRRVSTVNLPFNGELPMDGACMANP